MKADLNVEWNTGIISVGDNAHNSVVQNQGINSAEIDWARLSEEVKKLNASCDDIVKRFANEAAEPIKHKDASKVKAWLIKWSPYIGSLVATQYYILEIAARFGVL